MRVALLSYRSKPHSGGQGIYVRNLSRELVALGHDVEVVTIRSEGDVTTGSLVEAGGLGVFAATLRRALAISQGDWTVLVSSPVSAGLMTVAVLAFVVPMILRIRGRGKVLSQLAADED